MMNLIAAFFMNLNDYTLAITDLTNTYTYLSLLTLSIVTMPNVPLIQLHSYREEAQKLRVRFSV